LPIHAKNDLTVTDGIIIVNPVQKEVNGVQNMPRIIPGLQDAILNHAKSIFAAKGYIQTELRDVAKAAGTSVGNIYNYYRSKPHLFLAVTELWHTEVGEKLSEILALQLAAEEKLFRITELQYQRASAVQGLWKEFFMDGSKAFQDEECRKLWANMECKINELLARIEQVIMEANPDLSLLPGTSNGRWASVLSATVFQLPIKFPGQDQENLQFIRNLIGVIIRKTS